MDFTTKMPRLASDLADCTHSLGQSRRKFKSICAEHDIRVNTRYETSTHLTNELNTPKASYIKALWHFQMYTRNIDILFLGQIQFHTQVNILTSNIYQSAKAFLVQPQNFINYNDTIFQQTKDLTFSLSYCRIWKIELMSNYI